MSRFAVNGARVCGIAAAVPTYAEDNLQYSALTESERAMLVKTTGVRMRHIAKNGVTTSDLCYASAEQLISRLGWNKDEIGLLIFVSQSPDYFLPATSIVLQARLGLSSNTAAFDINLGCSGYVYGLSVAASMMATGAFTKALVLAGDISSVGITPRDKSTWPLFGDAGTATALEYDETSKSYFTLHSDGKGKDAIIIPDGGLRSPVNENSFTETEVEPGIVRHRRNLWLNGLDVFNFSIREVPPNITALMNFAGVTPEEIDYFIFHQANKLMIETIRKKLKLPPEKVPYSLDDFGNTSSASIPLTIAARLADASQHPRKWILSGFGVGLSWASACIDTTKIVCPEIQYLES